MAETPGPSNNDQMQRLWNRLVLATVVAFAIAAVTVTVVVPGGEAPDEPAHIEYIDHILINDEFPHSSSDKHEYSYESHQPPLYYATTAGLFRLVGLEAVGFEFAPDPEFQFIGNGRPAFLPHEGAEHESALNRVRLARSTSVLFGLIFAVSLFMLLGTATHKETQGFLAGVVFCLSPQVVFSSGTVNNDIGLLAFGTLATASLVKGMLRGSEGTPWLFMASVSTGLAIWIKVPGFVYLPAIFIVALTKIRHRDRRSTLALVIPCCTLVGAWLYSNLARFGSAFPPLPTGWDAGGNTSFVRLFEEPWWVISAWGSFWAKFGWFNLPLPKAMYLWFLIPSLLVVVGFFAMARQSSASRKVLGVLLTIVLSNVVLFTVYLAQVDWQPQGRYLFPSIGAFSVLCAFGLKTMTRFVPESFRPSMAIALSLSGVLVCFYAVWYMWQNYAKWSLIL